MCSTAHAQQRALPSVDPEVMMIDSGDLLYYTSINWISITSPRRTDKAMKRAGKGLPVASSPFYLEETCLGTKDRSPPACATGEH